MEKLLIATMKNPTPENKARLLAHNYKHPFAAMLSLSHDQQVILQQYVREAA